MKRRRPVIIWAVLLYSQLLYVFVAYYVSKSGPGAGILSKNTRLVLGVVAILTWLYAWFGIPRIFARGLSAVARRQSAAVSEPETSSLRKLFAPLLIQWVLFEAVTLYGFVIAVATHELKSMLPFVVGGILGFLLTFPSEGRIQRFKEQLGLR